MSDQANQGDIDLPGLISTATKKISDLTNAVILVMVIGFIAVLIAAISPIVDAVRFRAASYETLVVKVTEQGEKVDHLIKMNQCSK